MIQRLRDSMQAMNERVNYSHWRSPWYGNVPGKRPMSLGFQIWKYGDYGESEETLYRYYH